MKCHQSRSKAGLLLVKAILILHLGTLLSSYVLIWRRQLCASIVVCDTYKIMAVTITSGFDSSCCVLKGIQQLLTSIFLPPVMAEFWNNVFLTLVFDEIK